MSENIIKTKPVGVKTAIVPKKHLYTLMKLVVSGGLIFWVLHGIDTSEILRAFRSVKVHILLLAYLMNFLSCYIRAHRWRILLKAQDIDASLPFLIQSNLVGTFANNFLPSTIGGDISRAYDSWRIGNSKIEAVAVILVDRFMGMYSLIIFAVFSLLVPSKFIERLPFLNLWLMCGISLVLLISCIIFTPYIRYATSINKISLLFPQALQNILNRFTRAIENIKDRNYSLAAALGLSMIIQVVVVITYYLIAMALGFSVALNDFFLIVPIATLIMMIPVSINAIGVRENIFVFFLANLGVAKFEALAFSWLAYGSVVLWGMVGGIVYALRK